MGKISRRSFEKDKELITQIGASYLDFTKKVNKFNKFMLSEIEKLQDRVAKLELISPHSQEQFVTKLEIENPVKLDKPLI